ncbi:hypothetical protein MJO29_009838 [Puccinia striiformis f. sp. tritici]|nr:hypothetical protein MJO29_009838 [Puccinia striiformis f. sp. tritici]
MSSSIVPRTHNHDLHENHLTPLKRSAEQSDPPTLSELTPCKSRRTEFMVSNGVMYVFSPDMTCLQMYTSAQKSRIRIEDLEASQNLEQRSKATYSCYSVGNLSMATTLYEEFLGYGLSQSINGDGHPIIVQSIFNLTRCYLALGQFGKAQNTLQGLWDLKNSAAIGPTHSLFPELSSLYFKMTKCLVEVQDKVNQEPGMVGLERSVKSIQRRSQNLDGSGNRKAAVVLLKKCLETLPLDSYEFNKDFKNIIVELHLSLAKGYANTGRHAEAHSTLEQVWNPTRKFAITLTHKCFQRVANLYWILTNNINNHLSS